MRELPIGAPVRITEAGPPWARSADGLVAAVLDDGCYLVEFDEPLRDDDGDGPYVAALFARSALSTDLH